MAAHSGVNSSSFPAAAAAAASPPYSALRSNPYYHSLGFHGLESTIPDDRAAAICRIALTLIMAQREAAIAPPPHAIVCAEARPPSPVSSVSLQTLTPEENAQVTEGEVSAAREQSERNNFRWIEGKCLLALIEQHAFLYEFENLCDESERLTSRAGGLRNGMIETYRESIRSQAVDSLTKYLKFKPGIQKILTMTCEQYIQHFVNLSGPQQFEVAHHYLLLQNKARNLVSEFSTIFAKLFKQLERLLDSVSVSTAFLSIVPNFASLSERLGIWRRCIEVDLEAADKLYTNEKAVFKSSQKMYLTANILAQMRQREAVFKAIVATKFALEKDLSKESILDLTGGHPEDVARIYEARRQSLFDTWQEIDSLAMQLAVKLDILTDALRYHRFPDSMKDELIERVGAFLSTRFKESFPRPYCTRFVKWLSTGIDPG